MTPEERADKIMKMTPKEMEDALNDYFATSKAVSIHDEETTQAHVDYYRAIVKDERYHSAKKTASVIAAMAPSEGGAAAAASAVEGGSAQ
jgi:hypothetical protein